MNAMRENSVYRFLEFEHIEPHYRASLQELDVKSSGMEINYEIMLIEVVIVQT